MKLNFSIVVTKIKRFYSEAMFKKEFAAILVLNILFSYFLSRFETTDFINLLLTGIVLILFILFYNKLLKLDQKYFKYGLFYASALLVTSWIFSSFEVSYAVLSGWGLSIFIANYVDRDSK